MWKHGIGFWKRSQGRNGHDLFSKFSGFDEKNNPLAFSKYLKDTGWNLFQTKKKDVKVCQYEKGNEFYQVIILLEKSDYDKAIEAHEKGLYVEIEGEQHV